MTPDSLVPGVHALVLLLRRRGADLLRGCPAAGRKVKSRGTTTIAALPRGLRARSEPHALCAQYSAIYCTLHITHRCVCARRAWTYRHTNRTVMRLIYSPCAAAAPVHRARASTCGTDDGRAGVSAVAAAAKSESEPRPRGEAAWDAVGEPGLQRTQHAGSLSRAGLRAQLV